METVEQLNARFGAPGRIVFRTGFAGYPEVVLANRYGTAEVALLGANTLSYRPTGHAPVLFRPARRDYNRGESFHGGVPVCFPQFGCRADPALPQHGFARLMVFAVRGTTYSEEMTEITLGLKANAATRALWPHDFDFEVKISVSMKLNLDMTVRNTDKAPFLFSAGFHPYLAVRACEAVSVRGLDGLPFIDAASGQEGVQAGDFVPAPAPDHVFTLPDAPKHAFAVLDPGLRRALAVAAHGATRAVVWNCGAKPPEDIVPDEANRFVCVEPVSDWPAGRTLAPDAEYALKAAIQSTLEENA